MKESNINIRRIQKTDMCHVIDLLQSISNFKPSKSGYGVIWDEFENQSNVHSIVAIINGVLVGYGSVVMETNIRGGKTGHIEDIVSHIDYRKKGIGKAIVDELFKVTMSTGCYKVVLQCKEDNIDFYRKCGYEISGPALERFI